MLKPRVITDGAGSYSFDSVASITEEPPNFTFAGCGFLGIYHVGVASCLKEYAPPHMIKGKIGGASAGAIVAALILCEAPLGHCTSWTLKLATAARRRSLGSMHPSFNIMKHLREGLEEILPPNAHEICSNKLHVSMTRVSDGKNVVVTEFSTREELLQALLCSAFIPLWSGLLAPKFRGWRYMDGALSNNLPRINSRSITVSPFAGRSDICPKDTNSSIHHLFLSNTSLQVSMRNIWRVSRIMFPPHPEQLSEICKQGFQDALAFLKINKLVNCSRHLAIRSVLSRDATDGQSEPSEKREEFGNTICVNCAENRQCDRDLHPSVIIALKESVDFVNSGVVSLLKNTKPYRTLSVLCSPLYLPFDLTLLYVARIFYWLPSLHKDIYWMVENIIWYTKLMTKSRHQYSAKFVCQLAITELQQTEVTSDMVMTSVSHIRNKRIGFGIDMHGSDELEMVHQLREEYLETSKDYDSLDIDTFSSTGDQKPENHIRLCASCAASTMATPIMSRRASLTELYPGDGSGLRTPCGQYVDMFDQCVKVADHTEAVLAYYYKDEHGKLKTTEIFKLDESKSMAPPSADELVSALAAKKLKASGSNRAVVSAVDIENMTEGDSMTLADI
ncbi:1-acylglycerol-3-phosphate O-acyltransferase Pnpla3-like [Watersipora subatra]|uniref:1-acylglycerol-3-phosphate O-acyltransferase Pnpla3-like n=1 Tax=Watersipora subatra TaxID=2589382 RepID=UPI00355ADC2F